MNYPEGHSEPDETSFEMFYQKKKDLLRAVVFKKVGSSDLEDICQNTWRDFSKIFEERPEGENLGLLLVIAKRRIADHTRTTTSRKSSHDRYRQYREVLSSATVRLSGKSNADLRDALNECLTKEEYSFVYANLVEGKSLREIADECDKSKSRVGEIISKALCKLKNHLEK